MVPSLSNVNSIYCLQINKFHFTALGLCKKHQRYKQLVKVRVTQSGNVWAKSFPGYSLYTLQSTGAPGKLKMQLLTLRWFAAVTQLVFVELEQEIC